MANPESSTTSISLNNGIKMPILGFGTWKISDNGEVEQAVSWALEAGYRLIDTAMIYGNEAGVGRAIKNSGLPRSEIFITTKLWPVDFDNPVAAFALSLKKLNLDYVDLYLIHWPIPLTENKIWSALEKIYQTGTSRAIGVSNYSQRQLKKTLSQAVISPAVNQVHFSPFNYKKELLSFCKEKGIILEAYSPLDKGQTLNDKNIIGLAEKYQKTPAQIMIRWAIEKGVVVIPKSSNKERIFSNTQVFDFSLSTEDIALLDELS